MDKRTILAVGICMGILLLWWKIFPPTPPQAPPPRPPATAQQPAAPPAQPATGAAPAAPADPAAAGSAAPGTAAAAAPARGPEERIVLQAPGVRYVLSSWGGTLREVHLEEERFLKDPKDPSSGLQIIGTSGPEQAPLRTTFGKANFASPEAGNWTVQRPAADSVVFRAENDQVAMEKRYRVEGPYRLSLEVTVENRGSAPLSGSLELRVFGKQDPAKQAGGFWAIAEANIASLVCRVDDEVERATIESLVKEPKEKLGQVRWFAADDKYFAVAAVPHPGPAGQGSCLMRALDGLTGEAVLTYPSRSFAAGARSSYPLTVFAGPKYIDHLRQVKPGGVDVELDKVVDVTFAVLSRPLLYLLKLFHGWVGNWGIAIIMLTFFVKLLTFYPTHKAMLSGKKMQRLAPKMQALRKKFENDRQRLGVETMNLYKQHGVSPLGGCLPTLITMPIWIALFSTLNYSVELHKAPFFGYIHDLSVRDPYFITPLLMGGIMFLQMRMSPAGADPQQQKMMAIMMPIMFTAFSLFLPAGLALYTLTNSLLAIAHQLFINHLDKKLSQAGA
jgi:YidC/Oxa1 family membrane protein insertase